MHSFHFKRHLCIHQPQRDAEGGEKGRNLVISFGILERVSAFAFLSEA